MFDFLNKNSFVLFNDDTYAIITANNYVLYDSNIIDIKLFDLKQNLIRSETITDVSSLNISKPKINYAKELVDLKKSTTIQKFVKNIKNITFDMYQHPFIMLTDFKIGVNVIESIYNEVNNIHDISELHAIYNNYLEKYADYFKFMEIFNEYNCNMLNENILYVLYIENRVHVIVEYGFYIIDSKLICKYNNKYCLLFEREIQTLPIF